MSRIFLFLGLFTAVFSACLSAQDIRVAYFNADATPPIGVPVAYAITRHIDDSLSARGIVILRKGEKPVVLFAIDWIGISNDAQDVWRKALAQAAGTTEDRVSVHALHQHDGARCDFSIEKIMKDHGLGNKRIDNRFVERVIERTAKAVRAAVKDPIAVTSIGFGEAKVDSVASNRRVVGPAGEIIPRWSSVTDTFLQNAPEGLIDPWLKCVSFWNKNKPVLVLTYYATHPQSYYGKGDVTCEFVGIARNRLSEQLGVPVVHFNGASGNISAGKYNDGSVERRVILSERMLRGMAAAWKATRVSPLSDTDIRWRRREVAIPTGKNIVRSRLSHMLTNDSLGIDTKFRAAEKIAWLNRNRNGFRLGVSSLKLGKIWLLNIPGEAFIEYQLNAQHMRPDGVVCTAAYEDYGPGYIGTAASYYEVGGYETSDIVSGTSAEAEPILLKAIHDVLQ